MFTWREEGTNHFRDCKFSLMGVFGVSWDWPEVSLDSPVKATPWKALWVCRGVCRRVFAEEYISRCALWECRGKPGPKGTCQETACSYKINIMWNRKEGKDLRGDEQRETIVNYCLDLEMRKRGEAEEQLYT